MNDAKQEQIGGPNPVLLDECRFVRLILDVLDTETRAKQDGKYRIELAVYQDRMQLEKQGIQMVVRERGDKLEGNELVSTPTLYVGDEDAKDREAADGIDNLDAGEAGCQTGAVPGAFSSPEY